MGGTIDRLWLNKLLRLYIVDLIAKIRMSRSTILLTYRISEGSKRT